MTGPLYAIGRFCSRHHWPVIGAWLVLAVALLAVSKTRSAKDVADLAAAGQRSFGGTTCRKRP